MNQNAQSGRLARAPEADRAGIRFFQVSAAGILGITGAAKLWTALDGSAAFLKVTDPIVGLPFHSVIAAVATGEIVIAMGLLIRRSAISATQWLACMAIAFLVYRIAIRLMGWQLPCRCLGDLPRLWGLSAETTAKILWFLACYLLAGSCTVLLRHRGLSWTGNDVI